MFLCKSVHIAYRNRPIPYKNSHKLSYELKKWYWNHYLFLKKKGGPLLVQTWVLINQRCFLASLVETGSWFLDMSIKHVKNNVRQWTILSQNSKCSRKLELLWLSWFEVTSIASPPSLENTLLLLFHKVLAQELLVDNVLIFCSL